MDCREIELLMRLHMDDAITNDEAGILENHLAGCKACAGELALREKLLISLREIASEEIEAPPELCGSVMASLWAERRESFSWLPAAWRRTIAAAAALLLLAGGSAGVTAGLRMARGGDIIAVNPGQTTIVDTVNPGGGNMPNTGDSQPVEQVPGGPVDVQNTDAPVNIAMGNNSGSNGGASATEGIADQGKQTRSGAAPATALLSNSITVTSTFLKIEVNDLQEARAKAVALAAGAGVSTQVFPEQSEGRSIVLLRITVSPDRALGLIEELTALGTLLGRDSQSSDLTFQYNETMVKYMELQTRLASEQDPGERKNMENQAAAFKQQLDSWDAEAGKRIITLWLESN